MSNISILVIPLMFATIIGYGLLQRVAVFDCFIEGAKDGIETTIRILPALVGLLTAIAMFRASGALDMLCNLLSPLLSIINFPK